MHGGAPRGWLEFSASLNPCGTPVAVREAIARAGYGAYADVDPEPAERHLALDAGVSADHVLLTAGATEALRLAIHAYACGEAIALGPTYGEWARLATLYGARRREIRASEPDFDPPDDRFVAALEGDALAFLCEPNNPTGRALGSARLRRIVRALGDATRLIIDESFGAYASDPLPLAELIASPHVVVIRSLTKRLAIPGVRLGYVVAHPDRIRELRALRDPWSPGAHACAAARVATWALDLERRRSLDAWRARFVRSLTDLGVRVVASDAPFVQAHVGRRTGAVVDALASRRIAVRSCASFSLPAYVRLALRPPNEQDVLLAALAEARDEVGW